MTQGMWLRVILAISLCYLLPPRIHAADGPARIKVLIVDGYGNHDWRRTTRLTRAILEPTGLFDISVTTAPASASDPAYASWAPAFMDFDVVIQTCNDLGGKGPPWPAPVRDTFDRF